MAKAQTAHANQVPDVAPATWCQRSSIHPIEESIPPLISQRLRARKFAGGPVSAYLAAHKHSPLIEIGDAVNIVGTLDLRQRRTRFQGEPVSGKHRRITSQLGT